MLNYAVSAARHRETVVDGHKLYITAGTSTSVVSFDRSSIPNSFVLHH